MRRTTTLLFFGLPLLSLAYAAGGPDSGGYVFSTDSDPVGPPHAVIDRDDVSRTLGLGDEEQVEVALPFAVDWYGEQKQQVTVGDNGTAFFEGAQGAADAGCPGDGDWSGIAAYWGDLETDDVRVAEVGQHPYRMAVLDWVGLHPSGAVGDGRVQVWFQESSDEVAVVLDDVDFGGTGALDGGAGAYVGVAGGEGTGLAWSCAGGLASGSSAWFGPSGSRADDAVIDLGLIDQLQWGAEDGEYVGQALAGGDINGDGLDELLVGVPGEDRVYLTYGARAPLTGPLSEADARFSGDSNADLGEALALADLDGDGLAELIMAEPENDDAATDAGAVHIFSGGGWAGDYTTSAASQVLQGPAAGDSEVGVSLAAPGDVDGDGYGDLLIGAPEDALVDRDAGAVFLHFGGSVSGTVDLSAGATFLGEDVDSELGAAVAGGDADGDGLADLLLGAPGYADVTGGEGRAYLILGGSWSGQWDAADAAEATFTGEATNDQLGAGLLLSDLDGDGLGDIVIGAPRHDPGSVSRAGAIYLFDDGGAWSGDLAAFDAPSRIDGDDRSQQAGGALASGDVDSDGVNDLVIGGAGASLAATSGGGAWVFRELPTGSAVVSDADHVLRGQYTAGAAGTALAVMGDYNGDGYGDVAVGTPFASLDDLSGNGLISIWDYHPTYLDADGDGYVARTSDGADCDDDNASVSPGQYESSLPDGEWALDEDCDGWIDGAVTVRDRQDWWLWDMDESLGRSSYDRYDFEDASEGDELATHYLELGIAFDADGALYADGSVHGSPANGALAASVSSGTTNSLRILFEEGVDAAAFSLMDGQDPLAMTVYSVSGDPLLGGFARVEHEGNDLPGGRFVGFTFSEPVTEIVLQGTSSLGWGLDDLLIAWSRGSDRDRDGYTPEAGDCDDTEPGVHPGADEIIDNGVDDDCDGVIDGGDVTEDPDWQASYESPVTQVDFEDFDLGAVIDDEYEHLGLTVDGTLVVTDDVDGAAPADDQAGLADGRTVTLSFEELQPAVGFRIIDGQGTFTITGYADGEALYGNTAILYEDNVAGGTFKGYVYDYGVDTVEIEGPVGDDWGLDDVLFSSLGLDDGDGDGLTEPEDCDDSDPETYPGADEVWYDGVDQDCDGASDYDADGDGYDFDVDCADEDLDINPDATEIWYDGEDQDCDGLSDYDRDYDGHDDAAYGGDDCDDSTGDISPDVPEIFYDEIDQNCEPTDDNDADGDGYSGGGELGGALGSGDCDDSSSDTNPGAEDTWYDGVDSDCGGESDLDADEDGFDAEAYGGDDCNDSDAGVNPDAEDSWYDGLDQDCAGDSDFDADLDGYDRDVNGGEDCDDTDASINPDGVESSDTDGVDEDCDGVDEWDADRDGHRDIERGGDDCDDGDASISPSAAETCYDGVDSNCSGHADGDCDEDGYLRAIEGGGDCDDSDPLISPDAAEVCYDLVDADCDSFVDQPDCDGDGHDNAEHSGDDCDDAAADVSPSATDFPYDGIDANCDGANDYDADGDGHEVDFYGGDDCDDDPVTGSETYPGATEIWYDGVDQDCDEASDYDADGDSYDWDAYGGEDCDDDPLTGSAVNPDGAETWYDGVDQDCDGESDYDADSDGHDVDTHGGDDCDDADPITYGGAPDTWYDGVDSDCAGDDDFDRDGDGFPTDSSLGGTDCDDSDDAVNPSAEDAWYDGVDSDCSGGSDYDADADGADASAYGGEDCEDGDDTIGPEIVEICDEVDNDCDSDVDEGCDDTGDVGDDTGTTGDGGADDTGGPGDGGTGDDTGPGGADDTGEGAEDTDGEDTASVDNTVTGLNTDDGAPKGCGCSAGGLSLAAGWPFALLLLGWRRRERRG